MNIFAKNKDFNDDEIFSIHSFATELDEDTLRTEINGGSCDGSGPKGPGAAQTSSGGNTPKTPAITGTTPTTNPGTSPDGKDKPQSGNNDFSHSSGGFQDSGIPEEYLLAQEKALADLAGIKEIEYKGKNLIVNDYDDFVNNPQKFETAANFHLFTGKYGTAGNKKTDGIAILDKNKQVIHIFSDDKAIANCRDRLCPTTGPTIRNSWKKILEGTSDFIGNSSNATALLSDVADSIDVGPDKILDKLEVFSEKTAEIANGLTWASLVIDAVECAVDPSFDNTFNLAMDGISFIPIYGPAISTGLTLFKAGCEFMGEKTEEVVGEICDFKRDAFVGQLKRVYDPVSYTTGDMMKEYAWRGLSSSVKALFYPR